jgi:protein-disulfide isomerase
MHDLLLARQEELTARDIGDYAEQLGLDVDRFWDEVRRHQYSGRVAEDVATADSSGVSGTPSFFINGRRYQGAYDSGTLEAVVRAARRRAQLLASAAPAAG